MSVVSLISRTSSTNPVAQAVKSACASVAPSWPLDQMIAVNPYWQQIHAPFSETSAKLAALSGIRSVMPHTHWLTLYRKGEITDQALKAVIQRRKLAMSPAQCVALLEDPPARPAQWQTLAALFDQHRDESQMCWRDELLYQASQFCAAYFQSDSPVERVENASAGEALFRSWRLAINRDAGIGILMGTRSLKPILQALPDSMEALIEQATDALGIEADNAECYFQSLLFGINGWASYLAYRSWHQATDEMQGLLAITLAWEWIIWQYAEKHQPDIAAQVRLRWQTERLQLEQKIQQHYDHETLLWICFEAFEYKQQQRMQSLLLQGKTTPVTSEVEVQALFCIDVRSEVVRRALESQSPTIQTLGYAGFFGMPIHYQPEHTSVQRPQMPGLITTGITVSERQTSPTRIRPYQQGAAWKSWSQSPIGGFSMVESAGWWYAFKMLKNMWLPSPSEQPMNRLSHHHDWVLNENGNPLDLDHCTALAAGALRTIGIKHFAPTVLLIGHTSETANNLHAAGLECGACGGQSGEVNVRVLATLLNREDIRVQLNDQGFNIPANTRFIPGLHNTTTDDVTCFDDTLPGKLQHWLTSARSAAQSERARHFPGGLALESDKKRNRLFKRRGRDWSQVQPEWGLAGNRALIMAPRAWTRGIDLDGRCFLHDYIWQQDDERKVLEQLMTAPMIVTNWINMQYNASVTDNTKFGSGNKVLHNAVGNNIGVFEGNSGDLRIGLSKQSLHNGEQWMHIPERLSVYIAAPRQAIAEVVAKHDMLRNLIDNDWLYLFSWKQHGTIDRYYQGAWHQSAGHCM
ncbi:DUF2309 domain-containing protein [Microbulbifer salipaludis]|uniref:Probable inorganic carbon transporter subunit DabA n=1 Tax=Microbulbifer salipaludis TaxID=187980 RepID=A0ABS3E817_9GAMM|nr:DUF2309 domain-containing protein [Microbulbifer salipaludis]MBN8431430.1 DUF2309 domain-containing protein [Microbulbifer salipaludis]